MSPEEKRKLNEVYEWMEKRKRQQITFPLDDTSQQIINSL